NRAEMLVQLAIQVASSDPEKALGLGLSALSGDTPPDSLGRLLFSLANQDRELSDTFYRAVVTALTHYGYGYNAILISLTNYIFDQSGRAQPSASPADARLLIDYLSNALSAQASLRSETRAPGPAVPSDTMAQLYGFIASRGIPIIQLNAPERLPAVQSSMEQLSQGLTQQQREDVSGLISSQRLSTAISDASATDVDTQVQRAEEQKDPAARDEMLRSIALNVMRRESGSALAVADKIANLELRAQTEDDVNLVALSGEMGKGRDEEARRV